MRWRLAAELQKMEYLLVAVAVFLAFNNGANDNFKGFATVWGSDTLTYRQALWMATLATVLGSLAALVLAGNLVAQFSGRGLVPDAVAANPQFILSVACGAAMTIFLATWLGFPVSTTHALIGGLVGAGLGLGGGGIHWSKLGTAFFLPLITSPLVAATLGFFAFKLQSRRLAAKDCVCVVMPPHMPAGHSAVAFESSVVLPAVVVDTNAACADVPSTAKASISGTIDRLHIASAFSICFARAVNDTPKLAALLIAAHLVGTQGAFAAVCVAMAIGGLLFSRKVATSMSQGVSRLDHAQGFSANIVTSGLVLLASYFGLPVSTTHVSVGSIAGTGAGANSVQWASLKGILLSWLATLPIAASIAWAVSKLL